MPKSTPGDWRIVVDHKNLNKASSTEAWLIPNIRDKPKYFGVMDLTSGYHQASVDSDSRISSPPYDRSRHIRVGLQGAGSYFQKALSTEMFPGLIQLICELCLDDLIVPAKTELEFLERVRNGIPEMKGV